MDKKVIAVTDSPFPNLDLARAAVAKIGGELVQAKTGTPEAIMEVARDADAVLTTYAKVTTEVVQAADEVPDHLALRHRRGQRGYRHGDQKGIVVTKVPDYCIDEVSDHAMALLLSIVRKIPYSNKLVQAGRLENARRGTDSPFARTVLGPGRLRSHPAAGRSQGAGLRDQRDHL